MDTHAAKLKVEDVWPLAPLQSGLLFHASYDTAADDVYVTTRVHELEGELRPEVLRASWEALVDSLEHGMQPAPRSLDSAETAAGT